MVNQRREPEQRGREILKPSKYEALEQQAINDGYEHASRYEYAYRQQNAAVLLAQQISHFLNSGGDLTYLAQEISRKEHRTLQQQFMQLCMAFIADEAMLGGAGYYDLRNQATCAVAQQIMDLFEGETPGFPFI